VQRQGRQHAQLIQDQARDTLVRPAFRVEDRHLDRAQDQLAQQAGDGDDAAARRQVGNGVGLDIDRAHMDPAGHDDLMVGLAGDP
jgi:hypothetical protein